MIAWPKGVKVLNLKTDLSSWQVFFIQSCLFLKETGIEYAES